MEKPKLTPKQIARKSRGARRGGKAAKLLANDPNIIASVNVAYAKPPTFGKNGRQR